MKRIFPIGLALVAAACSGAGDSSFDPLFGPPANPTTTPDDIYGLWATTVDLGSTTMDVRIRIESAEIIFANRCTFAGGDQSTVGVTVAANVTSSDLVIKESKSASSGSGETSCRVDATPMDITANLSGAKLTLGFADGTDLSLVKLSD